MSSCCSAGPDAPVNPCLYWTSTYDPKRQKFDMGTALGPFRHAPCLNTLGI